MKKPRLLLILKHASIVWVLAFPMAALSQGSEPIANLLKAHGTWKSAPTSMEITGTSTRGPVTGPVRITATSQEEVLLEYGQKKQVATRTSSFRDDGQKVTPESTRSGFTQLDGTSVFWLVQLSNMPLQSEAPRRIVANGKGIQKVLVSTGRTQVHFSRYRVEDVFELTVDETAGLLLGTTRSFYPERPDFAFTFQTAFSDYRETSGVLLPYRIDRYVQGRLVETIAITQYALDVPAPSSLFAPRRTR